MDSLQEEAGVKEKRALLATRRQKRDAWRLGGEKTRFARTRRQKREARGARADRGSAMELPRTVLERGWY